LPMRKAMFDSGLKNKKIFVTPPGTKPGRRGPWPGACCCTATS